VSCSSYCFQIDLLDFLLTNLFFVRQFAFVVRRPHLCHGVPWGLSLESNAIMRSSLADTRMLERPCSICTRRKRTVGGLRVQRIHVQVTRQNQFANYLYRKVFCFSFITSKVPVRFYGHSNIY
jgi:hypothetical protein